MQISYNLAVSSKSHITDMAGFNLKFCIQQLKIQSKGCLKANIIFESGKKLAMKGKFSIFRGSLSTM